ncbi:MAG: Invasion associated locus family protein [Cypionkella sp.]|uniref:invasion associated locus B family protein n=1 Tax=Cypionkella sp. TaxID=2811411 RepID=UPI002620856D|nr:invasion associated locus B family protein [Cypionkella sp.]MDB5661653.1 Invasion associated locus family protein [Cypionkella sp.]
MSFYHTVKVASLVALLCSLAGAGRPAVAQDSAGWKVSCIEGNERCTAVLSVQTADSGKSLAAIGIQIGRGGKEPAMIAILPLGVELKAGFRAVVAGKAYDAPFEACFADGCRAVAALPEGSLGAWITAASVQLQFFPFGSDNPVSAEVPLIGLREALDSKSLLKTP